MSILSQEENGQILILFFVFVGQRKKIHYMARDIRGKRKSKHSAHLQLSSLIPFLKTSVLHFKLVSVSYLSPE
jgi:hypothetical protein